MTTGFTRPDPFALEMAQQGPIGNRGPEPLVSPAATLITMGQMLLDTTLSCFVEKGVLAPTRQSVYMAPIPADCEQVTVLMAGWDPTPAPVDMVICPTFRWLANFSVAITRCTPAVVGKTGKAPLAAKMTEAAALASADAEVLLAVAMRMEEFGPEINIVTQAPDGGFQTVELNISLPSTWAP